MEATAGPSRSRETSSPRSMPPSPASHGVDPDDESSSEHESRSERTDTDVEDGLDYETLRLKRIKENQLLLDELGIFPSLNPSASSSTPVPGGSSTQAQRKRQRLARPPVFDRSGYVISQPAPGQTFRMACVEMPSDRKIRKRISDGEYQDCSHWAEGEARRWKYGNDDGEYEQGEEVLVGGVGPDFRWRRWRGLQNELRREMKMRGELNEMDMRVTRANAPEEGVSEYSLLPGSACHQCRRKSEKLKMKCRNTVKECNAVFCETCCKRYSYFEFDPDARSFICPLCRDVCNCSNCIRKRDLAHLLDSEGLKRAKSLRHTLRKEGKGELTVQEWLEEAAKQTMRAPFDRVRIINADEDVVSPPLPPEEPAVDSTAGKSKKVKKGKSGRVAGPKGIKKVKKANKRSEDKTASPKKIKLKFTVPYSAPTSMSPVKRKPLGPAHKEVDSDGDTVDGWSGDEDGPIASGSRSCSDSSTMTPLSSRETTPVPRLAFPPREKAEPTINLPTFSANGFIHPAMIQSSSPHMSFKAAAQTMANDLPTLASDSARIEDTLLHLGNKRKRLSPPAPAPQSSNAQHQDDNPGVIPPFQSSSPDPIGSPFETEAHETSAFLFGRWTSYGQDRDSYNTLDPGPSGANTSTILSGDPPPYSHSPPRQRQKSDSPRSLLPPAPMAYSLAQHFRVGPGSSSDGDSAGP